MELPHAVQLDIGILMAPLPFVEKITRAKSHPLCMTDPLTLRKGPYVRGVAFTFYDVPYGRGALHFLFFAARAGDRDASSLDVNAVYCASEPGSNDRDNLEEMQVFLYHLSFLVLSVNSL